MSGHSARAHPDQAPSLPQAAPVDVSPESIGSLVRTGARALHGGSAPTETQAGALDLLVGVTHDLRSPLSAMLVVIERLRAGHSGPLTPQQEHQLGMLYEATFGIAALTNDALDLSRAGTPLAASGPATALSLTDVWRSVRALVQPIAEERGLLLRWSGPREDRRLGHPAALQRILLNLVTNALKFTVRGSVTVTALDEGNGWVRFRVVDTGAGLDEPKESFLVREAVGGVSSGGLGIGMCQRLLGALGSHLEIGTSTGPGACFEFALELPVEG